MQMRLHAGPRRALLRAFSLTQTSLDHQGHSCGPTWMTFATWRCSALCIPVAFLFKKPQPGAKGAA